MGGAGQIRLSRRCGEGLRTGLGDLLLTVIVNLDTEVRHEHLTMLGYLHNVLVAFFFLASVLITQACLKHAAPLGWSPLQVCG